MGVIYYSTPKTSLINLVNGCKSSLIESHYQLYNYNSTDENHYQVFFEIFLYFFILFFSSLNHNCNYP